MPILEEAARRRLFQTAALYIAVAWGGTEILAFLIDALAGGASADTARRYLAIFLIAGFPAAMYLAWTKDLGLKARRFVAAGTVSILVVAALVYTIPERRPDLQGLVTENSIAVLPFDVCEDRIGDRVLAGGLTGAVLNRLAQRDRLKVMGRSSVATVTETATSLTTVASLLGVKYLLNGVVCRDGLDLTLHAELLDEHGFIVWKEEFQQAVNVSEQVEQRLANLVDNGVAAQFGDVVTSSSDQAVNRRALEQFLIGEEYERQGEHDKASAAFEKALEIQPGYAEAQWALAYRVTRRARGWDNFEDGMRKARPMIEQALELAMADLLLDPRNYDANRVAGAISSYLAYVEDQLAYRDLEETGEEVVASGKARSLAYYADAERYFRFALAANPSDTDVRLRLATVMDRQDVERRKETLGILQQGLDMEPFHKELTERIAFRLVEFGRLREAMEVLDRFSVLPQGKIGLWWAQLEILSNARQFDEQFAYLIEAFKNEPEASQSPYVYAYVWWLVGIMPSLGLTEEAASLYEIVVRIPCADAPCSAPRFGGRNGRQFFLVDKYLLNTGHGEEVAKRTIEKIEGLSNKEILKAWYINAGIFASEMERAGETERAISLLEALQHHATLSSTWAERQKEYSMQLASLYLEVGRESDAVPLLQEIAAHHQSEVDTGVRHPETLMRLAKAYGWLGNDDAALEILDLAIDYGGYNMGICCIDYIPQLAEQYADDKNWWHELEDDPRFIHSRSRMRALVDQQRSNIRALLAQNDMDALLAHLMEPDETAASQ